MSDTINFRRLRHTPLVDLARGRVSGRLDWQRVIAEAELPAAVAVLITRVIRRTRLWRSERVAVADELIAHFADGLAFGMPADALLRDFGDPVLAARLIRRAKRRRRPLVWHAFAWARRAFAAVVLIYVALVVRLLTSAPTVALDYVGQFNAPLKQVPAADRAWPIYREALLALALTDDRATHATIFRSIDEDKPAHLQGRVLAHATPSDPQWQELLDWLDTHQRGFELLRHATAKPALGYVLGPHGSRNDAALGWVPASDADTLLDDSLAVDRNHRNPLYEAVSNFAEVLSCDLRVARVLGDAPRLKADLDALRGMALQLDQPFIFERVTAMRVHHDVLNAIADTLAERPDLFTDHDWVELAHRLAAVGGDAPASLVDNAGDRAAFRDLIQRLYTDDGAGDGHLSREVARPASLGRIMSGFSATRRVDHDEVVGTIAAACAMSALTSRREVMAECERLSSLESSALARPLRERDVRSLQQLNDRFEAFLASPLLRARFMPLVLFFPGIGNVGEHAERTLGEREGIQVAIALELYRRRHDEYPEALGALTPTLLPQWPVDRISGEPLRYRLIDGRPVVYSVGVDRDDDGGRAWFSAQTGEADPTQAGQWPRPGSTRSIPDGDWILYDGRPGVRR